MNMALSPDTILKLCENVPLDDTYTDTLIFENKESQLGYFQSKTFKTYTSLSYQRIQSQVSADKIKFSIRIPDTIESVYNCNYIFFNNNTYFGKFFYAFVKEINFISKEVTEILYEIDYFQTYMFDYEILPSFVEREHYVNIKGEPLFANNQPENIDIGPIIQNGVPLLYNPPINYIIVASTTTSDGKTIGGSKIHGFYSGLVLYELPNNESTVNLYLQEFANEGRLQSVVGIIMSPVSLNSEETYNQSLFSVSINENTTLDGYKPRNKKLYNYPFLSFILEDAVGKNKVELQPQLYPHDEETMSILEPIIIKSFGGYPPIMIAYPQKYNNAGENWDNRIYDYAIASNQIPPSPWVGNEFSNWLSQNRQSLTYNMISNTLSNAITSIGLSESSPISAIRSGISAVDSLAKPFIEIGEKSKQKTPILHGNITNDLIGIYTGRIGFSLRSQSITKEYAEIIDNYFDLYGYATNKVKVPNLFGRKKWNFVKTRNIIIRGSIPVEAMEIIKSIYNNGVRLWHSGDVGNYKLDNSILMEES